MLTGPPLISPRAAHRLAKLVSPHNLASLVLKPHAARLATAYLRRHGAHDALRDDLGLMRAVPADLAHLHWQVRRRKPAVALEFGSGRSTIAIAHALRRNHLEAGPDAPRPHLHSVETDPDWARRTLAALPPELAPYATVSHSRVSAGLHDDRLVSFHDTLPNIVPDFVYLDGPTAATIEGSQNGLSFVPETGGYRHQAAADMLRYESTLLVGFFMVVDSRYTNMHFLRGALSRRYRFRWNRVFGWSTFELMEWTGRSRDYRSAGTKRR